MAQGINTIRILVFVACSAIGIVSGLFVFAILAMGECLPRDGSLATQICDVERQREFWLYPLLVGGLIVLAAIAEFRGKSWGKILGAASGLLSLLALLIIEAALRISLN